MTMSVKNVKLEQVYSYLEKLIEWCDDICLHVIMKMEKFFTTKETKEEMVDNHDNEFKEVGYFENDCQK